MPNLTPIFGLPYPAGSDQPCDFAEQWCDFTEAIDEVMATFAAGAGRTVPNVPAAKLEVRRLISVPNGNNIPFDEVVVDTAGMTDIDTDPYSIIITRAGNYTLAGYLRLTSANLINSQMTMIIQNPDLTIVAGGIDRGNLLAYRFNTAHPRITLQPGDKVQLSFNLGTQIPINVTEAWVSAVWHSDL